MGQELYQAFEKFTAFLFNGVLTTPIISLDGNRINNLGTYRIGRNGFGAKNHININSRNLRSKIETFSTLLHEMLHHYQCEITTNSSKSNYHNKEFQELAHKFGIPTNSQGHFLGVQEEFIKVCKEIGLEIDQESELLHLIFTSSKKTGQSKLKKWTCGYQNVRVAIVNFQAKCLKCGNQFYIVL